MKLLLHTCCAPCLIYPLERIRQEGFEPAAYYYNPNIHPFAEYRLRMQAARGLSESSGAPFINSSYLPQEFFRAVAGYEPTKNRCAQCWDLRLRDTALYAAKNGFDYISTTLLVSPYQDQERLKKAGEEAATAAGVAFYYEDFRTGFRRAHDEARARGIYCQKYCGCIYSEMERFSKRENGFGSNS